MSGYDLRRLDADPTYAPGRTYDGKTPYWRPTRSDLSAGWTIKSYRLSDLTEEEQAAKCRALTRELLQWRQGVQKLSPDTWGWIIAKYLSDDLSPIKEVKANTAQSYRDEVGYWQEAISGYPVADTTFAVLKTLKRGMEQNGRTVAFIHRKFTHLRMVANYGLAVKPSLFRDVCSVLASGQLKVRGPASRTVAPTADHVAAIIAEADKAGHSAIALGLSLQWWLALRAVDVRGQWLTEGKTRRWADGLTWDMIDLKAGVIVKAQSKTERHDGRTTTWDLAPIPDLLARLHAIPEDERVGPVIKHKGKPFEKKRYSELFRQFATAAGVPANIQMRDTRAGAINDGLIHGADRTQLQHAAGHKDGKTTERYIRARDVGANKVIQMRAGK